MKKNASSVQEVEETVARIAGNKGVDAVMIVSEKGEIIQSTFSQENQKEQAKVLLKVKQLSASLFEDGEDLSFIRIRSQKKEILVAPHNDFLLVVSHNPLISSVEKSI